MNVVDAFLSSHGEVILAHVVAAVATTVAAAVLLWLWRIVWVIAKWAAAGVYLLLIGWWVTRIRRWVTWSMW